MTGEEWSFEGVASMESGPRSLQAVCYRPRAGKGVSRVARVTILGLESLDLTIHKQVHKKLTSIARTKIACLRRPKR